MPDEMKAGIFGGNDAPAFESLCMEGVDTPAGASPNKPQMVIKLIQKICFQFFRKIIINRGFLQADRRFSWEVTDGFRVYWLV